MSPGPPGSRIAIVEWEFVVFVKTPRQACQIEEFGVSMAPEDTRKNMTKTGKQPFPEAGKKTIKNKPVNLRSVFQSKVCTYVCIYVCRSGASTLLC